MKAKVYLLLETISHSQSNMMTSIMWLIFYFSGLEKKKSLELSYCRRIEKSVKKNAAFKCILLIGQLGIGG